MIFGIKDRSGGVFAIVCAIGAPADRFQKLSFSIGMPHYDGTAGGRR